MSAMLLVASASGRTAVAAVKKATKLVKKKKVKKTKPEGSEEDGLEGEEQRVVQRPKLKQKGLDKLVASKSGKKFAGGLVGGQGAFGAYDFDPLGLSEKFPAMLPFFREAELKHGRVAMLAFVGLIVPEFGSMSFLPKACLKAGAKSSVLLGGVGSIARNLRIQDAHDFCVNSSMPDLNLSPMTILLLAAGTIEIVTSLQKLLLGWGLTLENAGDYPGREEIGGLLNQLPKSDNDMVILKLQELKNGRLAMIAFGGGITQAVLCGNGFPWVF